MYINIYYYKGFIQILIHCQRTTTPRSIPPVVLQPRSTTATPKIPQAISVISTSTDIRTTSHTKPNRVETSSIRVPLRPINPQNDESVRSNAPYFQHPKQHTAPTQSQNKQNIIPPSR